MQRLGCDVEQSPPSNAEVKNEWNYNSTYPICPYRVKSNNFTFLLYLLLLTAAVLVVTSHLTTFLALTVDLVIDSDDYSNLYESIMELY
jgi:hypothetical protein